MHFFQRLHPFTEFLGINIFLYKKQISYKSNTMEQNIRRCCFSSLLIPFKRDSAQALAGLSPTGSALQEELTQFIFYSPQDEVVFFLLLWGTAPLCQWSMGRFFPGPALPVTDIPVNLMLGFPQQIQWLPPWYTVSSNFVSVVGVTS